MLQTLVEAYALLRGRRALLGLLPALVLFGGPAAGTAARAGGGETITIRSPGEDQLIRSGSTKVVVRLAAGAGISAARLDGRSVAKRFRGRGRTRAATFYGLKPGPHVLVISASDGHRRKRADAREWIVGRRNAVLAAPLSGLVTARSGVRVVRLRAGSAKDHVTMWLNGSRVEHAFSVLGRGAARQAELAPDDGLRYGRNRLRVLVVRPRTGEYADRTFSFTVPRRGPLASAGPDRIGYRGEPLKLDGSRSLAARHGDRLVYRWRVLAGPTGSHARVKGNGVRPRFRADRTGRYRVRLTVAEAGHGTQTADDATVEVRDPGASFGISVQTISCPGGSPGVEVGTQCLADPGSATAFQVVLVDRGSGAVLSFCAQGGTTCPTQTRSYCNVALPSPYALYEFLSGAQELSSSCLQKADSSVLAIVSQPNFQGDLNDASDLAKAFDAIGAEITPPSALQGSGGLSAVGVPGMSLGQGWANAGTSAGFGSASQPSGMMSGRIAVDSSNSYSFVDTEYVPFSLGNYSQPIKVGSCRFQGDVCTTVLPTYAAGQSGFQVLALDSASLNVVAQQTFLTNGAGEDQSQQSAMANFLGQYSQDPYVLVLVKSFGTPSATTTAWGQIATALAQLGGSAASFNDPNTHGYDMAGGYGLQTQDSVGTTNTPPALQGILTRNRAWEFQPSTADPYGHFDLTFMPTVYQPRVAWPFENFGWYRKAQAAITSALDRNNSEGLLTWVPDIRDNYYLASNVTWSTAAGDVAALAYPGQAVCGCSELQWGDLTHELAREFKWVDNADSVLSGLAAPLTTAYLGQTPVVQTIADNIEGLVAKEYAPQTSPFTIISDLLQTASSLAGFIAFTPNQHAAPRGDIEIIPEPGPAPNAQSQNYLSPGLGVLEGVMELVGAFVNQPNGDSLMTQVQNSADTVSAQLFSAYQGLENLLGATSGNELGGLQSAITGNYASLLAIGSAPQHWNVGPRLAPVIEDTLTIEARRLMYRTLVPEVYDLVNVGDQNASNCPPPSQHQKLYMPYAIATAGTSAPADLWNPVVGYTTGSTGLTAQNDLNLFSSKQYQDQFAPASLGQALFSPPQTFDPTDLNADFDYDHFYGQVVGPPVKCGLP